MAAGAEIIAVNIDDDFRLDSMNPAAAWRQAPSISFSTDWQGKNADPELNTEVRALWSHSNFYLRFDCRYRTIHVFDDCEPNGRRDHLWNRDVAEAFLQPEPSPERYYKEF